MSAVLGDDTLSVESEPSCDARATPFLFVAFESSRPLAGSARHSLAGVDEVAIGRGDERVERDAGRLRLQFPDARLSGEHATLTRRGDAFTLKDLDSKNGSHVNGAPQSEVVLRDGDLVQLGSTFFVFRSILAPAGHELDVREDGKAPRAAGLATVLPGLAVEHARFAQVCTSTLPIVVVGETGTGKELAARAAHQLSGRKRAFVAVNCGALPPALLEAELFGHKRGSFSGATEDRAGLLRASDGGTLFLDEIVELPLAGQAALLRALQEREVRPVGDVRSTPVDLRVVCAAQGGLEAAVAAGRFRADLSARLSGYVLHLPALRERREDLGLLTATLLRRLAADRADRIRFAGAAARRLLVDPWPMNIRALEKCLAAALVIAGDTIEPAHLTFSSVLGTPVPAPPATPEPVRRPLTDEDERRREQLIQLMEAHRGNISAVARELGKDRAQIRRWLRRFNLQ